MHIIGAGVNGLIATTVLEKNGFSPDYYQRYLLML